MARRTFTPGQPVWVNHQNDNDRGWFKAVVRDTAYNGKYIYLFSVITTPAPSERFPVQPWMPVRVRDSRETYNARNRILSIEEYNETVVPRMERRAAENEARIIRRQQRDAQERRIRMHERQCGFTRIVNMMAQATDNAERLVLISKLVDPSKLAALGRLTTEELEQFKTTPSSREGRIMLGVAG